MHRYCNHKLVYLTKYRSRGASRYFLNHKLVKACVFLFHWLKICKKVNEGKFRSSLNYRIGIKTQTLCHYPTTLLLTEDFHSSDRPEWFLPRFGLSELQNSQAKYLPSTASNRVPVYCICRATAWKATNWISVGISRSCTIALIKSVLHLSISRWGFFHFAQIIILVLN